jgi:polyphosphate kinase 2 (PPK2 family)
MLASIDLSQELELEDYKRRLLAGQLRMRQLAFELYQQKRLMVIVAEGWDAAGKGGAIRRLTEKVDPRSYKVFGIAAPKGEDKTHHYLWRFWRRLDAPSEKQILIFDRSWYGRVLVERVEGFASEKEWKRAYREINDFERQLTDHGVLLVKLWFHIDRDEQLRRFEARRATPHKAWKLTEEDWRNREKWPAYELAVNDMLVKTSTLTAPWTVVEGNDKKWSRVKTLETVVDALAAGLPEAITANPEQAKKEQTKQPKKRKSAKTLESSFGKSKGRGPSKTKTQAEGQKN